jgi:acyl-CoA synthetase (AMP-forming)/AMP-acid ligase II
MMTIYEKIKRQNPDSTAIISVSREPLSYKGLTSLIERSVLSLQGFGLQKGERIAIVLPNGPEMATVFLCVASAFCAAPLNPSYTADEFDFYLEDLQARAVVVMEGAVSPVRAVAERRGLMILEITASTALSGEFVLKYRRSTAQVSDEEKFSLPHDPSRPSFALPSEIALILHTSGTTSRPKIVPLTQANLLASAGHIVGTLGLEPQDRGLNVMPLFHIHGLIASLLAPLTIGSSVICSPGFDALKFFSWLRDFEPNWYSAVPTMHQTILARSSKNTEIIRSVPLRFIRSSSSSIPPQVIAELEEVFGCPLIESYGMTEASHQMASNPLPPSLRKPGTVGPAAGPQIAIMDSGGKILEPGKEGEVVIKGPNVTLGYEKNAKANLEAFHNGWFRTGDQGVIDSEGYLRLTGRLKEIINRGGEKISPKEVDEILMDHPAIAQVVTFGVPHTKLGEDIGAAIVLKEGNTTTPDEIREFAKTRLADFKIPRTILILEEIPKGATGKLQRIGLAQKLGLVE